MTTLTELRNSVYTITNRPDLVAETTLAIQTATLKEHAAIDYTKDLVSVIIPTVPTVPETYRYELDTQSLVLLPRKYKAVREILPADLLPAAQTISGVYGLIDFREVAVDNIFNGYQQERPNYYYLQSAGILNVVAARAVANIQLIYYGLVKVGEATYASWIADQFPYAIQLAAAASIYASIGRDSESKRLRLEALDARNDIIRSNVTDIG